ncbi:Fibroblast growth factor 8b [Holothuria leucospilota]|uniref:Fibroblast growth factor 8b n=1 Tax=Holothuria leucospilota TaxID=206669 RepID=A0A9Q1BHT4_HOLLE|nr:Fibroblast growth factor 8b [Holothuria leucospilota]
MRVRLHFLSILLHVVLWCICIQRTRQLSETESNIDSTMTDGSDFTGTTSREELCLQHVASNKYLRIGEGRNQIDAQGQSGNEDIRLIIETAGLDGSVFIKGKLSEFYLCINKRGDIVGRRRPRVQSNLMCKFIMHIRTSGRLEFEPLQLTSMYLGFRKNGLSRNAKSVKAFTRYSQFIKDEACEQYAYDRLLLEEIINGLAQTTSGSSSILRDRKS